MGNNIILWFIDEYCVIHILHVSGTSNNHTVTEDEEQLLSESNIWDYVGPAYFNMAQFYDSTSTYNIGDYVWFADEGDTAAILYKCTTAVTTPESWDSTKWTQVTAMDEIAKKQDALVSGTNIKTINNNSILGNGDLSVGDALPIGTEVTYDGASVPNGWIEVDNPFEYSYSEQKIGTWVDGKPIYSKSFYVSSLPNNNYMNVAHNISNIDTIIDIQGVMINPNNNVAVPINFAGNANMYGSGSNLCVRADRTEITIGDSTNLSANIAYIHLYYTKTTD
jgi:hypothetical protein